MLVIVKRARPFLRPRTRLPRLPSPEESRSARDPQNLKRGAIERTYRLRLNGWSHRTCMAYYDERSRPEEERSARGLIDAYHEELDLYAHGIQPPVQNRVSGRLRTEPPPFRRLPEGFADT